MMCSQSAFSLVSAATQETAYSSKDMASTKMSSAFGSMNSI